MFKKLLIVIGVLGAAAIAFVLVHMGPRDAYGLIRYGTQRREGDLKPGDRAPDASLVSLDGRTPLRISERIGGKPLVLVFGSFT